MRKLSIVLVTLFLFLAGTRNHAQVYIVIDGVEGESKSAVFKNSTELNSLSLGAENVVTSRTGVTGIAAGKASFSDISFTKSRGAASSSLQNNLFNGRQFPKAEIRYYQTGQKDPYLVIYLENVFVTGWKLSVDKTGVPEESVSIKYMKIKTEDWLRNADGSIRKIISSWDVTGNIAF